MTGSSLKVTFLGTGTSVGVPVLTCDCDVCSSKDPRNDRLRASLLLEWHPGERAAPNGDDGRDDQGDPGPAADSVKVLIDTSTDLRQQALRLGLERVDAVLYTHQHADHLLGLDELRIYNFVHRRVIPLYGNAVTMEAIQRMFAYAFEPDARGVPRLSLNSIDGPFELLGRVIVPVPVRHAKLSIFAYRIGDFAYATDCSEIPDASAEQLQDLDVLVVDALRRQPHPAHFTLDQALAQIDRLQPRRALLTHLSHEFDHGSLEAELPEGVGIAYDGMVLEMDARAGQT